MPFTHHVATLALALSSTLASAGQFIPFNPLGYYPGPHDNLSVFTLQPRCPQGGDPELTPAIQGSYGLTRGTPARNGDQAYTIEVTSRQQGGLVITHYDHRGQEQTRLFAHACWNADESQVIIETEGVVALSSGNRTDAWHQSILSAEQFNCSRYEREQGFCRTIDPVNRVDQFPITIDRLIARQLSQHFRTVPGVRVNQRSGAPVTLHPRVAVLQAWDPRILRTVRFEIGFTQVWDMTTKGTRALVARFPALMRLLEIYAP
jgi:hypothetical protein